MLFAARDFLLRVQTRGELSITAKNVFLPIEQWAPFCARGDCAALAFLVQERRETGGFRAGKLRSEKGSSPRRSFRSSASRLHSLYPLKIKMKTNTHTPICTDTTTAVMKKQQRSARFCRPQPRSDARIRRRERPRSPAYPAAPERSAAAAPQELNFKANQIPIGHCILSQQSSFDTSLIQKGAFQTPFLSFLPATL